VFIRGVLLILNDSLNIPKSCSIIVLYYVVYIYIYYRICSNEILTVKWHLTKLMSSPQAGRIYTKQMGKTQLNIVKTPTLTWFKDKRKFTIFSVLYWIQINYKTYFASGNIEKDGVKKGQDTGNMQQAFSAWKLIQFSVILWEIMTLAKLIKYYPLLIR